MTTTTTATATATVTVTEAAASVAAPKGGRMLVRLIDAGQGSSGFYPPETLAAAAETGVFGKGLHLYADHPSETERLDRPERSIRDIAGVLTEDARFDADTNSLVAEAKVFTPWAPILAEMSESIGLSIRAAAEVSEGERDGTPTIVVDRIVEAQSVDFVTHAGRGGRVLSLLESTRVTEALASDVERALSDALRTKLGDESGYVIDHDADQRTVIYSGNGPSTWRAPYTVDNGVYQIGDATEVRRVITYQPTQNVPAPAGQPTTTQESREDTMPQIEETRLRQLEEDAGRVQQLTETVTTLTRERDEARTLLEATATAVTTAQAQAVIAEAGHAFTTLERRGLLADLPVDEHGVLDHAALQTRIAEAAAEVEERTKAAAGRGFGSVSNVEGDLAKFDEIFGGTK